jgi:cytochrome c biogenesis protein CcmG/thiol:disulfide interchange protein DsbE
MVQEPDFLQVKAENNETKKSFLSSASFFLIAALLVFVLVIGIALFRRNQAQPVMGDTAPDFELTSYDGQSYRLEELRGRIVILNFWANWCAPCHAEAPQLEQVYREYADNGVLLLGINWLDIESEALSFIERYDLSYPSASDAGEHAYNAYHVQGLPETFVIDSQGKIAATFIGAVTYEQLSAVLDRLLGEDV